MDSAIKMANDRQAYVSADEETIRIYEMREKARLDWNSSINHARREGLKEGQIKIARKLKAMGIPAEQVHEITGLDPQTIKKLK